MAGEIVPSPEATLTIAVDAGLDRLLEQGLSPDIVVGDFDSVGGQGRAYLEAVDPCPEAYRVEAEKDFSDLDMALRVCAEKGIGAVTLSGFVGGRIDHQLAVFGVCARYAPQLSIALEDGQLMVTFLAAGQSCAVSQGRTFSVFALEDDARVSIVGAQYPLTEHRLTPLSDYGLSNYAAEESVVSVLHGVVAVIVPS
ncbi:MAG: thiamine diphosphokinase [Coriobacteriia bacterium]|nr:thiamine diphosphokinase [Coriobacteriia bacterium]